MTNLPLPVLVLGMLMTVLAPAQPADPPVLVPQVLSRAEAEQHLKTFEKLNPKLKEQNLFQKLQAAFGHQESYTLQQVFSLVATETIPVTKEPVLVDPAPLARETVRQYFKVLEALDAKRDGQNLFGKLQAAFKVQESYTAAQVLFIANPKAFVEKVESDPYQPAAPLLAGGFSRAEVSQYFAALGELDKAQKKPAMDRMLALTTRYGNRATYLAAEIREVESNPDPKKTKVVSEQLSAAGSALDAERRRNTGQSPFWNGLNGFKIRKDWSDVVAGEDPSQSGKKTLDDLEGAKFSYSHDARAKSFNGSTVADTWSAVGAVIYPFTWRPDGTAIWVPGAITLAPSISINKVSTQNPTNRIDHLDYRLGLVADWQLFDWGLTELQGRGAMVYDTDTGHQASLPAGELDLEPKFAWRRPKPRGRQWGGLGYRNILIEKEPSNEDLSDDSLVDWQLRTWAHLEGGDLQRNGAKWETADGGFFRIGPVVQGVLNFPELLRGFSISGQFTYLEPLSGAKDHRRYWKVGGSLTLYQNPALKHKISLTADYQEGGLTLSKQPVDIVTVGVGITY